MCVDVWFWNKLLTICLTIAHNPNNVISMNIIYRKNMHEILYHIFNWQQENGQWPSDSMTFMSFDPLAKIANTAGKTQLADL